MRAFFGGARPNVPGPALGPLRGHARAESTSQTFSRSAAGRLNLAEVADISRRSRSAPTVGEPRNTDPAGVAEPRLINVREELVEMREAGVDRGPIELPQIGLYRVRSCFNRASGPRERRRTCQGSLRRLRLG